MAENLILFAPNLSTLEVSNKWDSDLGLRVAIDYNIDIYLSRSQTNELVKFLIDRLKEIGEYQG